MSSRNEHKVNCATILSKYQGPAGNSIRSRLQKNQKLDALHQGGGVNMSTFLAEPHLSNSFTIRQSFFMAHSVLLQPVYPLDPWGLGNPNLIILDLTNLFVADAHVKKKSEPSETWV